MTVEQYWLSETIITACGMTGAALTLLCLTRRGAPRLLLMLALVGAGAGGQDPGQFAVLRAR